MATSLPLKEGQQQIPTPNAPRANEEPAVKSSRMPARLCQCETTANVHRAQSGDLWHQASGTSFTTIPALRLTAQALARRSTGGTTQLAWPVGNH